MVKSRLSRRRPRVRVRYTPPVMRPELLAKSAGFGPLLLCGKRRIQRGIPSGVPARAKPANRFRGHPLARAPHPFALSVEGRRAARSRRATLGHEPVDPEAQAVHLRLHEVWQEVAVAPLGDLPVECPRTSAPRRAG